MLDLGCGPGRHLAALRALGKRGLGVDLSPVAVASPAAAARRDQRLAVGEGPRRGRVADVLLLDGNIGIGGDPVALLSGRRAAGAGRRVVVETDPPGAPTGASGCARGAGHGQRVVSLGAGRRRGAPRSPGARASRSTTTRELARPQVRTLGAVEDRNAWPSLPRQAPPGPFRPGFLRSPLRGPWLTGDPRLVLLVLSGSSRSPASSRTPPTSPTSGNAIVARTTATSRSSSTGRRRPTWLYALTQGLHMTSGYRRPGPAGQAVVGDPAAVRLAAGRSPGAGARAAVDRAARLGALFLFATGVFNVQFYYPFKFNFVVAHYYGAFVFVAALVLHVGVKMPVMRAPTASAACSSRCATTRPHAARAGDEHGGLVAADPGERRRSRAAGCSRSSARARCSLLVATAGQSIGGPFRQLALLAPRRRDGDFPVNKTARGRGVTRRWPAASYRLVLRAGGARGRAHARGAAGMPQRTARLPIACVEGWSTTQEWTGVPLADARRARGRAGRDEVFVESLQPAASCAGRRSAATSSPPRLAARAGVDGDDLSLDHGFPARIIVPALPGVHNTKWVGRMTFRADERLYGAGPLHLLLHCRPRRWRAARC